MKNPLENYKDQKVCIIGLGYVGLTLALSMAEVGFVVQGVEVHARRIHLSSSRTISRSDAHTFLLGVQGCAMRVQYPSPWAHGCKR